MKADSPGPVTEQITLSRLPALLARGLIRAYQLTLSPFIGNQCRFHPSCSNYALEAIGTHGALKGSWLTLCRLGRCHPFNPGGFDPVPGQRPNRTSSVKRFNEVAGCCPDAKET